MSDLPGRVVPDSSESYLSDKQLLDYETHRRKFIKWLTVFGKDPDTVQGYADSTVINTADRCGRFDRWVWEQEGGYSIPTREHANEYLRHLAYEDNTDAHRSNTQASLARYLKWRHHDYGEDEWDPELSFSKGPDTQPRDFLSIDERRHIRQAALEYGSIPAYESLSPEQRTRWKNHVSQILRKPLEEVVPDDWKRVNGWKFTSIVWTSLDTGLRPAEVGRATVGWVDTDNHVLRIPVEDSTKNSDNWLVSLSERTSAALDRWLSERGNYDLYANTDALWLTREGNPYGPNTLRRLMHRLCDIADIDTQNRQMSWYTIRHSVGTYMTREEDLAAAKAQLRHKSIQTTVKYDAAPVEDRRDALDRMG